MTENNRNFFKTLAPRNIGAVYVWLLLILIFSLWIPYTFLRSSTPLGILNQSTVTAMIAMAVIMPLAVGVFDLSIGAVMGFSLVTAGWLLGNTDLPIPFVIVLTLCGGALMGLLNAFVILKLRIDSFIATLATGAIISAITVGVANNKILTVGIAGEFSKISTGSLLGIPLPVYYMLIIMIVLGFVLERTATGRRMYAAGFGPEAARLAGINVDRLKLGAILVSAILASFAGIILLGRIQAADPMAGNAYMMPAFSAAFLGATQFRGGRFNSWGTVVAVLMLQTGSYGLLLTGVGQWAPQVFQGVVLIVAVGITVIQRKAKPAKVRKKREGAQPSVVSGSRPPAPEPQAEQSAPDMVPVER
ncbi:ABC transporter permease [Microbacterium sp. NC79]|uniref:ABC transporter permease n=1 Tax=Microbacterium sp. NC79 TaxID=2851009 RepID=UPI001C2C57A9|nr:ABC transporter permease [Microbacterium sp. NC79]